MVLEELAFRLLLGRDFMFGVNFIIDNEAKRIYCREPRETQMVEARWVTPQVGQINTLTVAVQEPAQADFGKQDKRFEFQNYYRDVFLAEELVGSENKEGCPFYQPRDDHPYIFRENLREVTMPGGVVQVSKTLSEDSVKALLQVCGRFATIFSFDGWLGDCNVLQHTIDTGDARPIHTPPYRNSYVERLEIQRQIRDWLASGVIQPSCSPWSSPGVLVPKKNGSTRMCVDLRKINMVTKRDVYPLPAIDSLMASLNGKTQSSSIDLNQGYMQIRVERQSVPKVAFITEDGLFEFLKMPFGLTNAPATFQRCMDIVLAGLKWNSCLVYLDDIIVFEEDESSHNRNLGKVLAASQEAGLTIEPSKCAF